MVDATRGRRAVGLDVGHSAVKLAVDGASLIFPSVVIPAFEISDEASARRAAKDRVRIRDVDYYVGDTAVLQGGLTRAPGLYDEWVLTDEHDALLKAGFGKAQEAGARSDDLVVLGLPANLYPRYRGSLRERASALLQTEVMVMPQPFGPFSLQSLDEDGVMVAAHRVQNETWAVIEVGFYTTDFALIKSGVWVDSKSTSCRGVSVAAEQLRRILNTSMGLSVSTVDADTMLRTRKMKYHGEERSVANEVTTALRMLSAEIKDAARGLFAADAHSFDGIIITGGGADVVFADLAEAWPRAVKPDVPRFSVAEGLRRQGLLRIRLESEQRKGGA